MRFIFVTLLLSVASGVFAQTVSGKRGLAYGNNSLADLQVLTKGVSWYYNWDHQPEGTAINFYETYNFDYVPMAWGAAFNKQALHDFLSTHPNVKYILGWNEPNFIAQSNLTPSQAAAHWSDIEDLADEFNLKIVGPAVNYCGDCVQENGTTYTDPVKYLDDFFAACSSCRVDYIAIHCYMANVSALQWYVGLFKKYGKPIWLTEFAAWEGTPTPDDQKNYMVGAVDYLENDPDVFRYAWFTGRYSGAPYIGILKDNVAGELAELGNIYVNMPLHDAGIYTDIPAVIEAENYAKMDGVLLEVTKDETGFADVGYIDSGDWLEYNVNAEIEEEYNVLARVASVQSGSVEVKIDGVAVATLSFASTGGYQTWQTFSTTMIVPAGQHVIRVKANNGGFNLNWFQFKRLHVTANEEDVDDAIVVYPNPSIQQFQIAGGFRWKKMEVINMQGMTLHQSNFTASFDAQSLSSGVYIMKFTDGEGAVVLKRIIKQ